MRGAFQIAKIANIQVFIHWSFSLIFIWVGYVGFSEGLSTQSIFWLMGTTLMLFLCVILHEFGHSAAARKYGVVTRDNIVLPIGGVARLERIPEIPKQEFFIAIAGPLVNVFIALITGIYVFASGNWSRILMEESLEKMLNPSGIVLIIFIMNISLFVFNLIPAFPMDGGRILRSLLSMKWDREKATKWAANIGQMIAILFFAYGLSNGHYGLLFIGLFIFFSANSEYQALLRAKEHPITQLKEIFVRDIYHAQFTKLHLWDPVSNAIDAFNRGHEDCFLVFNAFDELEGTINRNAIINALLNEQQEEPIKHFYTNSFIPLHLDDTLDEVIKKFARGSYHILPVMENEQIIGVVDHKAVDNALFIQRSKVKYAMSKRKSKVKNH